MQILYEAANGIEAQLLQGLLAQHGIEASIAGAYLQGGMGELPVMGLVHLTVEDEDVLSARKVIADYEAGVYSISDEEL